MISAYEKWLESVRQAEGTSFPAKSYANLVLKPAYDNAKIYLLDAIMEVNRAHLVMLYEQGLVEKSEAEVIARALDSLDLNALQAGEYTGRHEDLFFEVESNLLTIAGDTAGNLHMARSRNDMCVTMYRMVLRRRLKKVLDALSDLTLKFTALAQEHKDTVMVAITHTQQAQVSTIGHYLLGACQVLRRDFERLSNAYKTINKCPMGACAITTTGYTINRDRMAELLGFDGFILNSYDAIAGGDYLGEAASAMQLAAINAGRIVQDFLLWASQEFGVLRAGDPYVQISSIMPQKRNPVSLEHLRSLLSGVGGRCTTMLQMLHNTPYGDIVDTEDDAQPFLWDACDALEKCYHLWGNVMLTASFNKEVMMDRAKNGFSVITELADTLNREAHLPFRKAHKVAANIVRALSSAGRSLQSLQETELNSIYLETTQDICPVAFSVIKQSLDPIHFISIRNIPGGCGPVAMDEMLESAKHENQVMTNWCRSHSLSEEAFNSLQAAALQKIKGQLIQQAGKEEGQG